MTLPYDKSAAVVLLPAIGGGRLQDKSLKCWLSRGTTRCAAGPQEPLAVILGALNRPYPESGLAALRMWGQTGDRPTVWIAALDPVYLEPRLNHLCLHALTEYMVPTSDLRGLLDHLQATLAADTGYGFARIGKCGYLRASEPIATAQIPADVIDQCAPDEFMPTGETASEYRKLVSEIEMVLHDHDVNHRREVAGQPPVNGFWLWGGGTAPELKIEPHPPLFGGSPLLQGYWRSVTGVADNWPGSIEACLEASVAGFVAVPPIGPGDMAASADCLLELRDALREKRLSQLQLFFGDGIAITLRRNDRLRIWRRSAAALG